MNSPKYLNWIAEESGTTFEDNILLTSYKLDYCLDEDVFYDWALHIRKHYISDDELIESLRVTGLSAEDYLRQYIVPQKKDVLGPTSRSNDITEILISDLLEFVYGYKVPRCKQRNRSGKTQSEHGTDVIAYKFHKNINEPNKDDELVAAEVKAKLTASDASPIIDAATDSKKDDHRFAHTLDYYRKKLKYIGKNSESAEVARFLQKAENNYKTTFIGAAISSQETVPGNVIIGIKGEQLCLRSDQKIFYIHGKTLMKLTHDIYERCIK
jgi:hypothetical protein